MAQRWVLTETEVRPATPEDVDELRLLVAWSERGHLRFQTSRMAQIVQAGLIQTVHQGGRMAGFFYVTMDNPNSSVRGLVVRPGYQTPAVLEPAMEWIVSAGAALGSLSVVFIGDDRWLVPHLQRAGFERAGEIVGLHRPGSFLPVEGNVSCRVRPAASADVDQVVEVDWSAFEGPWQNGRQTTLEFLAQMPYFLVAEQDGRLLGYVCGTNQGRSGHIVRLAVRREAQRRGIGTRLLREVLQRMAAAGARALSLNTQRENVQSQAFYRALGFTLTRRPTSVYRYHF
ncbi:MAG: GNAT family N-acetyltransferase [Anaerolineae bacterium]|nr:GNAT family N-acetyltransferase [Anaerolineae bacterium]